MKMSAILTLSATLLATVSPSFAQAEYWCIGRKTDGEAYQAMVSHSSKKKATVLFAFQSGGRREIGVQLATKKSERDVYVSKDQTFQLDVRTDSGSYVRGLENKESLTMARCSWTDGESKSEFPFEYQWKAANSLPE